MTRIQLVILLIRLRHRAKTLAAQAREFASRFSRGMS